MNIFQTNNRILGQPTFLSEGQDEKEDKKAAKKALNEMNKTQNTQFALSIIQSLLASNSGTTFESIESVHSLLFLISFCGS